MVRPILLLALGAAAILIAGASGAGALAAHRYTAEEAARGKALYAERCATCHGDTMKDAEEAPALVGARFDATWRKAPDQLYAKIKRSMPQDDPGTLTAAEAAEVTATILQRNHVPLAAAGGPPSPSSRH